MEEFTWLPKNIGKSIERSSSNITFPHVGCAKLNESSRYSGNYLIG